MATAIDREQVERPVSEQRGLGDLIKELRNETTTLCRQEIALAKAELSDKMSRTGRNVGYLAAGAAIAYLGAVFLLLSVSALLIYGLNAAGLAAQTATWLAPLLIGLVVGAIGYAAVQKALRALRQEHLVPEQTMQSLKDSQQWAQRKMR